MHPTQQRPRASNEFRRGLTKIRFKLTEALAAGGSANAYVVRRNESSGGDDLVDTTTVVKIHDAFGEFTGQIGQYGYALWFSDGHDSNGGRFEVLSLVAGGGALFVLDANLGAGTLSTPATATASRYTFGDTPNFTDTTENVTLHNPDGQIYLAGTYVQGIQENGGWQVVLETIIQTAELGAALGRDGSATATIQTVGTTDAGDGSSGISVTVYGKHWVTTGKQVPNGAKIQIFYHRQGKIWLPLIGDECQEDAS